MIMYTNSNALNLNSSILKKGSLYNNDPFAKSTLSFLFKHQAIFSLDRLVINPTQSLTHILPKITQYFMIICIACKSLEISVSPLFYTDNGNPITNGLVSHLLCHFLSKVFFFLFDSFACLKTDEALDGNLSRISFCYFFYVFSNRLFSVFSFYINLI